MAVAGMAMKRNEDGLHETPPGCGRTAAPAARRRPSHPAHRRDAGEDYPFEDQDGEQRGAEQRQVDGQGKHDQGEPRREGGPRQRPRCAQLARFPPPPPEDHGAEAEGDEPRRRGEPEHLVRPAEEPPLVVGDPGPDHTVDRVPVGEILTDLDLAGFPVHDQVNPVGLVGRH